MHRGYVKWWRRTVDSAVFQSKTTDLVKVWAWCLMRAAYRQRVVSVKSGRGSIEVEIQPGQFIFGRHSAAAELPGLSSEMVRKRMEKLKNMRKLTIETTSHYSVVTICNWALYQGDNCPVDHPNDQPTTSQRPADDQPTTTNKKEEKGKKDEKEKKQSARADDYDPLFEQFWQTVPPRKRGGKQDAARAYRVAVGLLKGRGSDPHEYLCERAQAYYASPLGQTQFCSGAGPFLRQGHYDDDPQAWERQDDQTRRPTDGRIR